MFVEKLEDKFLWASGHNPTSEQLQSMEGEILFLKDVDSDLFETITNLDKHHKLRTFAERLLKLASKEKVMLVQPAGSPAFQQVLGYARCKFCYWGIPIAYAYSERVSIEQQNADGSVTKTSVFKHLGWIIV